MRSLDLSKRSNSVAEPFDWDKFDQSKEGKEAAKQNKLENLKDEVKYYNTIISNRKKELKQAERALRVAKRQLKAAQEEERANKIKALLEANADKSILIYHSADDYLASLAKDVIVYFNANNCWCVKRVGEGNQWEIALRAVERIYVEAEF